MLKFLADLVKRLTSRKFLLSASSVLTLAANSQWTALVAVVAAYLAAEGGSDAVQRYQAGKTAVANIEKTISAIESGLDPGLDKTSVVPGADPVTS